MISILQPIEPAEASPVYDYTIDLDDVMIRYRLVWRERQEGWYLDVWDADGNAVLAGVRMNVGWPVLWRYRSAALPPGQLMLVDTSGGMVPPTSYDTLGQQYRLVYASSSELTEPTLAPDWDYTVTV